MGSERGTFGATLLAMRQRARVSQTELAHKAGLSLPTIQRAERLTENRLRWANWRKLREALAELLKVGADEIDRTAMEMQMVELRLPSELAESVDLRAKARGLSIEQLIVQHLSEEFGPEAEQPPTPPKNQHSGGAGQKRPKQR